ncbi:UDP-3-O-acyl-N-acetylglucosamine deacetylase [Aestuariibius sp. 2305UL40-4]|uniref:UDP-3-O-acyl-N-acetylglucosamine deacetylase n=1 Tax=Aestuariibius violaceus TaxID=3234132 RepID=UPI00345E1EC1
MQTTLTRSVSFTGVGLHGGRPVRMVVRPAPADHGIWFVRTDLDVRIPALWDAVAQVPLCTRLDGPDGVTVSTIEHIMAALAGCGIGNVDIELDGPEVPILDGSAAEFVRGFLDAGLTHLDAPAYALEVLRKVEVKAGLARAAIYPADGLIIDFAIDFPDPAIGHQRHVLDMRNGAFVRELCDSRTFCRKADVEAMHAQGLALGGSLDNAVVVDGARVLSPGGLRHADEAVRHKMLDALGDLATAGAPILGHYEGVRAGHALTNALLRALFATPGAVRLVECGPGQLRRLPGSGLVAEDLRLVA